MGKDAPRRAAFSLADLLVFVLGCAIALSLPKIDLLVDHIITGFEPPPPGPAPSIWMIGFWRAINFTLKFEMVLAIVALGRCLRLNRLPRPAEWLAILAVFVLLPWTEDEEYHNPFFINWAWVFRVVRDSPTIRAAALAINNIIYIRVAIELFLGASICVVCLTLLFAGRDRLSARIKTFLIIGLAYSIVDGLVTKLREDTWGTLYDLVSEKRFHAIPDSFWSGLHFACSLPLDVLFGIALLATFRARRDASVLDRAILISLVPYAVFRFNWLAAWPPFSEDDFWRGSQLILVILLSLSIRHWLGPIWSRWLRTGYDRTPTA